MLILIKKLINKIQRPLNKGEYKPELDGLRFIAIFGVVNYHLLRYYSSNFLVEDNSIVFILFKKLFSYGGYGVQLFFSISGFILFKNLSRLKKINGSSIKNYYLKRLYRIEPPYIITILGFYILLIASNRIEKWSFGNLISSLFYAHNFVYEIPSIINGVSWSLEIEIIFYLLLPFILIIQKSINLKPIFFFSTLLLTFQGYSYLFPNQLSFLSNFHYFVLGIIAHIIPTFKFLIKSKILALSFFPLVIILMSFSFTSILLKDALILFILLIGLNNSYVKSILSFKFFSKIGLMCYSLYLLHYKIISVVGIILKDFVGDYFFIFLLFNYVTILLISTTFFLIIEKPFMKVKTKVI